MNKKYYTRFAKRLRIVTMTSMIALFSLMVVVPNSTGFAYAQSTSAQIQALLAQVSKLKSAVTGSEHSNLSIVSCITSRSRTISLYCNKDRAGGGSSRKDCRISRRLSCWKRAYRRRL